MTIDYIDVLFLFHLAVHLLLTMITNRSQRQRSGNSVLDMNETQTTWNSMKVILLSRMCACTLVKSLLIYHHTQNTTFICLGKILCPVQAHLRVLAICPTVLISTPEHHMLLCSVPISMFQDSEESMSLFSQLLDVLLCTTLLCPPHPFFDCIRQLIKIANDMLIYDLCYFSSNTV